MNDEVAILPARHIYDAALVLLMNGVKGRQAWLSVRTLLRSTDRGQSIIDLVEVDQVEGMYFIPRSKVEEAYTLYV